MSKYKKSDLMKMRAKQFENLKKFPSLHPSIGVVRYWDEELQKYYFLQGYYSAQEETEEQEETFPDVKFNSEVRVKR